MTVIETAPLGTELDDPLIPNAVDIFPELMASAESTLDIAQLYMLYYPPESKGSLIYRLYDAVADCVKRGVRVRIILDSTTLAANPTATYRLMRARFADMPGAAVRAVDLRPHSRYPLCMMHAKYFVIDGRTAVIGSHNWSFAAFADNQELSLAITDSNLATAVLRVFEQDWQTTEQTRSAKHDPMSADNAGETLSTASAHDRIQLAVSGPAGLIQDEWPLTAALTSVIAGAESLLDIAVNSITPRVDFGHEDRFALVESLLLAAAGRGVRIRLLVDRWAYEQTPLFLRELDSAPNLEVRVIDISRLGPNPRTGTLHAKFLVADRSRVLLGTATLSHRQLTECRNLAVVLNDTVTARILSNLFDRDWFSVHTHRP